MANDNEKNVSGPDPGPRLKHATGLFGGEQAEVRSVIQPQTIEESEELIISMTSHAMREPDYWREKQGLMALTIAHAREEQVEIDARKRAIHRRIGPIEARAKQRMERNEEDQK